MNMTIARQRPQLSIPIDNPLELEEVTKESVEVAEEMENSGDLEMESDNLRHEEADLKLSASSTTKYKIINKRNLFNPESKPFGDG